MLGEVFSNEGIGTLIHANEYQAIRPATQKDVRAIYALIQGGVERDELVRRTPGGDRAADRRLLRLRGGPQRRSACAALHLYPDERQAELACVVRRSALREPGHRRQADALRRGPGAGARGRRRCSASRRRRSTTSSRRAASLRDAGRPAAGAPRDATTEAAGARSYC